MIVSHCTDINEQSSGVRDALEVRSCDTFKSGDASFALSCDKLHLHGDIINCTLVVCVLESVSVRSFKVLVSREKNQVRSCSYRGDCYCVLQLEDLLMVDLDLRPDLAGVRLG